MTRQEFLALAIAAAQASSARSGFPPGITVAQAALESGWGNSRLAREAHNYFGIKQSRRRAQAGLPYIELPTVEVVAGAEQRIRARFARYGSMAECFAERDELIARLACYAAARDAGDPEAFTRALAKHWATDPKYAEKVLAIYHAHELFRIDSAADARG